MPESRVVSLNGHLIDSMILPKVMDKVMNRGGEFEFLEFEVGKNASDTSRTTLRITGRDRSHLESILDDIHSDGAVEVAARPALVKKAPRDMTLPPDFYSTTNNPTRIFRGNEWVEVQNQMMDKCIVIRGGIPVCSTIRDVRAGEDIVCGDAGVQVVPPPRPRESADIFAFMGSSSSSERPTPHIARMVATRIRDTKRDGGRVILVGGPAIVHTGASASVAALVRMGCLDGILAGNALAVHDIESSLFGTSLGMHIKDATLASKGYRNHMDTVNAVFTHGSIPAMVESGALKRGIFYECVRAGVPFVLAGSIRDDGPLPDVITDVVEAQNRYKAMLKGVSMVIMVSTMLHSIAVGNMLPSGVQVVAIDISQPTVTKLVDRGTWQAMGIVTDVGAFLPLVEQEIRRLDTPS